jgi:uncharacterized protein YdeI (YjbR/CyaY-like superfamily)
MGRIVARPVPRADVVQNSRSFRSRTAFRKWLEKNHARAGELLLRCVKVDAAMAGVIYREALDEALCFGWIDGVRRGVDAQYFSVRFTPRKKKSRWSRVNIRRATELIEEGRMHPAGLAAFRRREKSDYSFESAGKRLSPTFLQQLRAHPRAWRYYLSQPPWYRRTTAFWIMSGKRPETRKRRFQELLASCATGRPVPPLGGKPTSKGSA